ncbi:hypothetical protein C1752_00320 [Acaryochloris thomasi RCC1774]|uniref:Na+-translocating membrane potential-generating system MpsC domain-containing protein n=1 Tax=Acaryochloris thomasi RCC1774 TaxID=1764569 RepID=A0A2W1JYY6_9CYAN|nr:DUF2294 domain-containing protein [Acaryochloris thomasi]PZD75415.1 hypothetical protein C1752_00320 [Acaryochloris thomasi RCC1774]
MPAASKPTIGQLERSLSQKIQALYREQLGHLPSKVTCQIFGEKLAVVIEDSLTQPEKLLVEEGQKDLATQVRSDLDDAIQPQLKTVIEDILGVQVLDVLSDATLSTGRTGLIAVLDKTPEVRNPASIPKAKSKAG